MGNTRKLYERILLSGKYRKEEVYWLDRLKDPPGIRSFPYDMRGGERSGDFQPESYDISFSRELCHKALQLSNHSDLRLHLILLAVVFWLLHKYSGKKDLLIGMPILKQAENRDFINTVLPIRDSVNAKDSFKDQLIRLRESVRGAVAHQNYPVELLLARLGLRYTPVRQFPLFDVTVILENIHSPQDLDHVRTNMGFAFRREDGVLKGTITFNNRLYRIETIQRLGAHVVNLLDIVLTNPELLMRDLDILLEEERNRLLREFDRADVEFPPNETIVSLFSRQVEDRPGRIAVCWGDNQLSYACLDEAADSMAREISGRGIHSGMIVVLLLRRSHLMISAILAALKSGAVYLPVDPRFPADRVSFMVEDSGASLILRDASSSIPPLGVAIPVMDVGKLELFYSRGENNWEEPLPGDPAYIIYTSGTTGNPKGVMVSHKNVARLMTHEGNLFDFSHEDTWTMFHSYCFDFSVWEMYGALLAGGRLVIVPRDIALEPNAFRKLLAAHRVTVLNQTPSAFYNLSTAEMTGCPPDLAVRYVIFGGEELHPARLRDWRLRYPRARLINMFGITETTVHVTFKEIERREIETDTCNIGKPLPTLSVFVLDHYQKMTPTGVAGELYVGGEGVALGYLNRPELTTERFVPNPYAPGEIIYRSGDLARVMENVELEYLGRIDRQVQVRGFRIELGEIVAHILRYEGISEAVVVARDDEEHNKMLICYFVSCSEVDIQTLRDFLRERLTDYMIPHYFVKIETLPLTANGKLDHAALPDPRGEREDGFLAARNEHERLLVEIWQEVLQLDSIGIRDNFFVIGGDSIKAIKLLTELNEATGAGLKIVDLFLNETVEKLAALLAEARTDESDPVMEEVRLEVAALKERCLEGGSLDDSVEDIFPMGDIQEGMAYHYLRDRRNGVYHDQMVHQLNYPDFDAAVFRKALDMMVRKHEILRTSLNLDDFDIPVQMVHRQIELDFGHHDITHLDRQKQEAFLKKFIVEDRDRPFEISTPPLWRFRTFRLDEENVVVLWVCHHAIMDGWSDASFKTELHNLYTQLKDGRHVRLRSLQNSYKTFVLEQMAEKRKGHAYDFWKRELDGYKRLHFNSNAPSDGGIMKNITFDLGEQFYRTCSAVSEELNTSVKNICFSAYLYMLYMISWEPDLLVGMVCHNRPVCEDSEKILGCFLNTLPVRLTIPSEVTCADFIRIVEQKLLEIKQFERLSFFEIVKLVGEDRGHENPLFDTVFNFMDFHVYRNIESYEDSTVSQGDSRMGIQGFVRTNTPVNLDVDATLGAFIITFSYHTSFLDDSAAEKMCGYFRDILESLAMNLTGLLERENFIEPKEMERLLMVGEGPIAGAGGLTAAHEQLAGRLESRLDRIALVSARHDSHVTYRELERMAEELACRLKKRGAGMNVIVPLLVEPSVEMIAGILGILKANAAYLPIDPGYPRKRIDFILKDCDAGILVTQGSSDKAAGFEGDVLTIKNPGGDDAPPARDKDQAQSLDSLAYVIYTSGSTGEPKGVLVEHGNLAWYLEAFAAQFQLSTDDTVIQQASFTFDAFVEELYPVSLAGGTLAIPQAEEILDSELLWQFILRHRVTMITCSPLLLNELNKLAPNTSIHTYISGGDRLDGSFVDRLLSYARFFNAYGPTESTVCATYGEVEGNPKGPLSIGTPITGCRIYVLDRNQNIMPYGVQGELAVAGGGIARGYLNRPRLTADKFVQDPVRRRGTVYLTGDLVRWRTDGQLEFLGRIDQQIKIRGYRIELGEVERQLLKHEDVSGAVVNAYRDNGTGFYLCAFISSGKKLQASQLREYLKEKVPHYMVPARFAFVDSIPLTAGGKPNRRALPAPKAIRSEGYQPPVGPLETGLTELFAEVLEMECGSVGIYDNFFDLGGHSIKATILSSRIHKTFGVKIPIGVFFKGPTVKELAKFIQDSEQSRYDTIEPVEKKDYYSLSSAQKRLWVIDQFSEEQGAYKIALSYSLEDLDVECFKEAFHSLVRRHEILRTTFVEVEGEPRQRVHTFEDSDLQIEIVDFSNEADGKELAASLAQKDYGIDFDLTAGPLARAKLVRLSQKRFLFFLTLHHIIADAWSVDVLQKELMQIYEAAVMGGGAPLKELDIQYKDYSDWQNSRIGQGVFRHHQQFWMSQFESGVPVLDLQTDFPRPKVKGINGDNVMVVLDRELGQAVRSLCKKYNCSLFMTMLSTIAILLYYYSGQEDLVIGSPIAGRDHGDLEEQIGFYLNMLPLRISFLDSDSFASLLGDVKQSAIKAFQHQAYPFDLLINDLKLIRDSSRSPLFDVLVQVLNTASGVQENDSDISGEEARDRSFQVELKQSKYDLVFNFSEMGGYITLYLEYNIDLFKRETVELMVKRFEMLLRIVTGDEKICIKDIHLEEEYSVPMIQPAGRRSE